MKLLNCLVAVMALAVIFNACSKDEDGAPPPTPPTPNPPKTKLEVVWEFNSGTGIHATPLFHNSNVYFGNLDGDFYALESATGNEIWSFAAPHPIHSQATTDGEKIIFESGNVLIALSSEGTKLWEFSLSANDPTHQIDYWDYYHSSPIIHEGSVFIGSEDGMLYEVDLETGNKLFSLQTDNKSIIRSTPIIKNGRLIFGDWDGKVYVYSLQTKELLWSKTVSGSISDCLYAGDVNLYVAGRSAKIEAFDLESGAQVWSYADPIGSWLTGGPILENDHVFITASDSQEIIAFNKSDGSIAWRTTLQMNGFGKPSLTENHIIATTSDAYDFSSGKMYLLEKSNGKLVLQENFSGLLVSSPIVEGNHIYIGCGNANFYCYEIIVPE